MPRTINEKAFHVEGTKMRKPDLQQSTSIVIMAFALMLFVQSDRTWAQPQLELRQSVERKFEQYRTAIKDTYKVDIKNFKDRIPGGNADRKPIISYDLKQLLDGIKSERDHSKDNMLALELAMDHLEVIPDYYTRLARLEWECQSEKLRDM
jgi:hypothetical protein